MNLLRNPLASSTVVVWRRSSVAVMWPMIEMCALVARAGAVRVRSASPVFRVNEGVSRRFSAAPRVALRGICWHCRRDAWLLACLTSPVVGPIWLAAFRG